MAFKRVIFRVHALQRMFEREISHEEVMQCLESGSVIEDYPEDKPYPSQLMLGWFGERPIHVLVAKAEQDTGIVITVYEPDAKHWLGNFEHRRTK